MNAYFATCPRGLEALLEGEITRCGGRNPTITPGGVAFEGDAAAGYRLNLHSRVGSRVLLRVASGPYKREDDVYKLAHGVDWTARFAGNLTIRVDTTAVRSPLRSIDFITLRIKDAVCDRFREKTGFRPSIDTRAPDVRIAAFLTADTATIYLDTSGEPLHRRGYRKEVGEAPLRENLAAGMILLAGWSGEEPFLDPMCGSGTLLVEAASIALNVAPGARRRFGFEKWLDFDATAWEKIRAEACAAERPDNKVAIFGADRAGNEIGRARENLRNAGFEAHVELRKDDVLEVPSPAPVGVMVTNPPYGERIEDKDSLALFYPKLGDSLKRGFPGWRCYLLSADPQLPKLIGLKASKRTPLFNGPLECRLFEYRIVAGFNRDKPVAGD